MKREDLKYETKKFIYDFQQYQSIRSFGQSISNRKANIVEAGQDQSEYFNASNISCTSKIR